MTGRLASVVVALVCGVVAIFLAVNARDASRVRDANEHGAAGRFEEVIRSAQAVKRRPADLRALLAVARAHTAAGRLGPADKAWAAVARRDPNRWQVHYEWAIALFSLNGDRQAAVRHYLRAFELRPSLPPLRRR